MENFVFVCMKASHGCGQPYCSMCGEDIVLYLGCHHVHLGNHFEGETKKSSQKYLRYSRIAVTESL